MPEDEDTLWCMWSSVCLGFQLPKSRGIMILKIIVIMCKLCGSSIIKRHRHLCVKHFPSTLAISWILFLQFGEANHVGWKWCYIIWSKFGFLEFDHLVLFNLWFYHSLAGYLDQKRFAFIRETAAAIAMQKYFKCWFSRYKYLQLRVASLLFQSSIRGFLSRLKFLYWKEHRAATFIQVTLLGSAFWFGIFS